MLTLVCLWPCFAEAAKVHKVAVVPFDACWATDLQYMSDACVCFIGEYEAHPYEREEGRTRTASLFLCGLQGHIAGSCPVAFGPPL